MQPIHRVAILGAGALGAMYAQKFRQSGMFEVGFVARGGRAERLASQGVVVNGNPFIIPVFDPETETQPADLLLVALKDKVLLEGISNLGSLVGEETTIISVMNGLDSEDVIASVYGWENLFYCVAIGMDSVREGNDVVYANLGKLQIGEAKNSQPYPPKLQRLIDSLEQAQIDYLVPEDMIYRMWWKVMVNVGVNQLTAVLRVPYGEVQQRADLQAIMEAMMEEVIALGQAEGVPMSREDIDGWYKVLNTLSPVGKTSMLQDVEAGRPTEVDVFGGKMVRLGQKHGIPTPVNQAFVTLLALIESSYSK